MSIQLRATAIRSLGPLWRPAHLRTLTVLPLLVALGSCGLVGPCGDGTAHFGLDITIVDAATGGPPTAVPITVATRTGTFSRTETVSQLPTQGELHVIAADSRPGTYEIEVNAPGYQRWMQTGVRVREDRCGQPRTERVTARLVR